MSHIFKPSILYVEDDDGVREQLVRFLEHFSSELTVAKDGKEGLALYEKQRPDIVVSDIRMPHMNGIEMLKKIKEIHAKQHAILTSAYSDTSYLVEAIDLQIDGYILKPINLDKLESKLEEIVEHMNLKQELSDKISFDHLTGLYSRHTFFKDTHTDKTHTIFLIDINEFKLIGEIYGSDAGSKTLVAFTRELEKTVQSASRRLYRLTADVFAIIDNELTCKPMPLIEKILISLNNLHLTVEEQIITIDTTIGISIAEEDGYDHARAALNFAKSTKEHYAIYTPEMDRKDENLKMLQIKNDITSAINEKRVKAVYQPIVDQQEGTVKYEILMRLQQKDSETLITPEHFLDVARKTRLYKNLSETIIFEALRHINTTEHTLSINLNYSDILDSSLMQKIETFLQEHHDVGRRVVFEIVENENIQTFDTVKTFMDRFRQYGVTIAIDDFGTDYSNFNYIFEMEPDFIKIDGSLIKEVDTNPKSRTLIEAIVDFSHKLGIKVIAEHVHTKEIFEVLKKLKVDEFQGYYFSTPLEHIED